tara:strand:- start:368 stop:514 length:147 start_codon:yes stop_codon:yes gene_type:complete
MLKNEIHDIVISLENIREARKKAKAVFDETMKNLEHEERHFIVYLSNL